MTIFQGTAKYYSKYRPQYPKWVIEALAKKLNLDGQGALLDIGTGTGTLAIPLSMYFKKVLASDIDPGMVSEGEKNAKELNTGNIEWLVKNGEDLNQSIGMFDVITFGNCLHWFDQDKILKFAYSITPETGAVVDIGASSIWRYAPQLWQQKTLEVIKRYLGEERLTVEGKYKTPSRTYSEMFQSAGFARLDKFGFYFDKQIFTVEDVINAQFSYSYASRELFGDKVDQFAEELKSELLKINPDGKFEEETAGTVLIGWKK